MIMVLGLFSRTALLAAVVVVSFFDSFAARAIPFSQLQTSLIVPLGSGCGLGVRHRPFEACDPVYYAGYGSGYRNNYYTSFVTRGV